MDDNEAIVALIHQNRIAIWMRDFDSWSECFVHQPYLTRMGWWAPGGVFWRRGWDEISARLKHEIEGRPEPNEAYAYDTKVTNLQIRVAGDMAWATFDQTYPGSEVSPQLSAGLTHELRIFERHDGSWKIALLGLLDVGTGRLNSTSIRLDREGKVLWASPRAQAALEVDDDLVISNGRLKVRDRAANKKLQVAIAWAAGVDNTYMSTQGAVPIVMDVGEGLAPRAWWIVANAEMIHFLFEDSQITARRLEISAVVYGLSPAQKTLAAMVAEGLTLSEIANRMSIRVSTARTHLDRIFDKTGVRSQTALVRVLLSTAAPI